MDDDWSQCPICFEDYSLVHRPTTFVCGHSTCIDHTFGKNRLRECPICRHPLNEHDEHNVSYNLEASCLYHLIKNTIDEEIITRPTTILALILAAASRLKKNEYTRQQHKKCGHYCFLTTTSQCCSCSDKRPHSENNRYDKYFDGHGIQKLGRRNQHYCPSCKRRRH